MNSDEESGKGIKDSIEDKESYYFSLSASSIQSGMARWEARGSTRQRFHATGAFEGEGGYVAITK